MFPEPLRNDYNSDSEPYRRGAAGIHSVPGFRSEPSANDVFLGNIDPGAPSTGVLAADVSRTEVPEEEDQVLNVSDASVDELLPQHGI